MNVQLQSEDLQFDLALPTGGWDVRTRRTDLPAFEGATFGACWRTGMVRHTWSGGMQHAQLTEATLDAAPATPNRSLLIELEELHGIKLSLELSLGLAVPSLFWRVRLENHSQTPIRLERVDMFRLGEPVGRAEQGSVSSRLRLQAGRPDLAFFTNGWESWNATGALGRSDRFPRTRLGPLTLPMSQGAVMRQPRRRAEFTSEMFGVLGDRRSRLGLLLGFLAQREAFGGLRVNLERPGPHIHVWAECDGAVVDTMSSFSTDWCCLGFIHLDDEDPLGLYLDYVARLNHARNRARTPVGWCSWYQFNQAVTQDDVYANLEWVEDSRSRVPLEIIQLDDGFAAEVGDWYTASAGFPTGLEAVSRRIRNAGCVPGLWLAPFVAKPGARILQDHPDWILRNRVGLPTNAGFIWDRFTRALDVTHPRVIEHVENLVSTAANVWGFDYLKLDFLYAGALRGIRHDPHLTRAQALRSVLERIRLAAGQDRFLVGCGCPLGSGVGIFDSMRIGPDVGPSWEPAYRGLQWPVRHEPGLPSARNAIHNAITRVPLDRRWWINDPDCLILRGGPSTSRNGSLKATSADHVNQSRLARKDETRSPSRLTWDETKTLATVIALSAGSFFVSDHLPNLPDERLDWLARLLPPLQHGFRAIDWFDEEHPKRLVLPMDGPTGEWSLIGLINWGAQPSDLSFDLRTLKAARPFVHAVDFWSETYSVLEGEILVANRLAPHGVRLYAIRPRAVPQWIGDTLHIAQGLAISRIQSSRNAFHVDINLGRRAEGKVWLELPSPPRRATMNGNPIDVEHVEREVYVCKLAFEGSGTLEVGW